MTISAAVIALNEQANLPGLLASLRWVDEIVVVDGGSRDDTFHIARRAGCHVVTRPMDTFARQRNFAADLASGDWVLSIDADERPTPQLVEAIRLHAGRSTKSAFRVPIRSRIFGRPLRYSGTQDDHPIRLWRRGAGRWSGDVHEVFRVEGAVGQLPGWLEHETLPDLHAFLAKMHRYTLLEARARVAAGQPPRRWDAWWRPAREVFRRMVWKLGLLDGPAGWKFCIGSGVSEWLLARRHQYEWSAAASNGRSFEIQETPCGKPLRLAGGIHEETPILTA